MSKPTHLPFPAKARLALMACEVLIRGEGTATAEQEVIDLARMALGLDPVKPTQHLCGHQGCTLNAGHKVRCEGPRR